MGVDGEDWAGYGERLEERLADLCRRLHTNGYLDAFRREVARAWLRALRRRSQKGAKLTWASVKDLIECFLPKARVRHPYPNQRLRV